MPCSFSRLQIPDVYVITPAVIEDDRGFFCEIFKTSMLVAIGCRTPVVQSNHSRSVKGVLRGLHYQLPPCAQAKIVHVIAGEIFDVAVDIRVGSPTYGKWVAERLSGDNKRMLFIPEGFAHGFCVMSDVADVIYYCTHEYASQYDRVFAWNDPSVSVAWPVKDPILSNKDRHAKPLSGSENTFVYGK